MSEEAFKSGIEGDGFSKAFSEILSNPEMMSAISSMAQKFKSGSAQNAPQEAPPTDTVSDASETKNTAKEDTKESAKETSALVEKFPEILGMLSSKNSGPGKNRRSDLLCALKPYLSQSRTDAIDQIIKLSELSSVFKNLS